MESRTSNVVEFVAEACSTFCDTYYKKGCGDCPMNLSHGQCLLTDLPQLIQESIYDHLKQYRKNEEEEFDENTNPND